MARLVGGYLEWSGKARPCDYDLFFLDLGCYGVFSVTHNLSLIPVLGLLVNMYLMTQMGALNWERFLYWCLAGLLIYFGYSYRKSKLNV